MVAMETLSETKKKLQFESRVFLGAGTILSIALEGRRKYLGIDPMQSCQAGGLKHRCFETLLIALITCFFLQMSDN